MQVRSTESLTRRTSHHLNRSVQDYSGSGTLGINFAALALVDRADQPGSDVSDATAAVIPEAIAAIAKIQASKKQLRRDLRRRRRSLTPLAQRAAARALYRRVVTSKLFRFSRRLAFTIARDGEIDTRALIEEAWRRGKRCYLPVMSTFGESRLNFREWKKGAPLKRSAHYNIPEPHLGTYCSPLALSLVTFPLVGFDPKANRLGMGKGYYDHTFAFLRRSGRHRPALLGFAHECQRVDHLPTASWDVPLQGIATDQHWYTPPLTENSHDPG